MGNPTFSFDLGKPLNDEGRWVVGRITGDAHGYALDADLCFSQHSRGGCVQMHHLKVRVDRPFSPAEFVRLLRPMRTDRFATATDHLRLTAIEEEECPGSEIVAHASEKNFELVGSPVQISNDVVFQKSSALRLEGRPLGREPSLPH